MNIAIYSRKSKYSEKGDSIDNQIQYCKDYVKMHLKQITEPNFIIYEDEGFSAATTIRPSYQKLLEDIKVKKIQVLICYRLDRINRNVSDFSKTLELLEECNISFISATENFDTSTPMGKAMIYIASVFAQLERETTAERVRDNMLALSRTGRWLGGLSPLGYQSESILYMDESLKERQLYQLVPIEKELNKVLLIFLKYKETQSLSQLETYCLTNHIKTQKNCDFTKNSLSLLLQNPTYCIADKEAYDYFSGLNCIIPFSISDFNGQNGILCYNRTKHLAGNRQKKRPAKEWIVAIGKHRGIITGKDFAFTQNLLKQNRTKGSPRKDTSQIALFSGLITCSCCGSRLRIKNIRRTKDKVTYSYVCEMKVLSKGARCQNKNLPGASFDEKLLTLIRNILLYLNITDTAIDLLLEKEYLIKSEAETAVFQINTLNQELTAINDEISNLLKQLSQNSSPLLAKYILPQLDKLDGKKKQSEERLHNLTIGITKADTQSPDVLKTYTTLTSVETLLACHDVKNLRALAELFIKSIYWDGQSASIKLNLPSYEHFCIDS
ncbi:resolvase [Anaerocolumna cellulosilytica]|uniref:Resolvase n=1 Tax=Anaerocolumna cellulosilytica TaxID=433286 RepID=A0A6S6R8K1_9FIRM|nr:recombinase family protein [Anaerocolumna cellulosilytica]MBB5196847.1 site-specific DNA recombinase [Anaerocolumna cellulosilytica]BCJ95760.1 resolvase [Anaerocolumna cellulosilytica]